MLTSFIVYAGTEVFSVPELQIQAQDAGRSVPQTGHFLVYILATLSYGRWLK